MKQSKKCEHCGNEFISLRSHALYCSNTCRQYGYLTRKINNINGQRKEGPVTIEQDTPALVIESQEEPVLINQSVKEQSTLNEENMGKVIPINSQTIVNDDVPVIEWNDQSFTIIDQTAGEAQDSELIPATTYQDHIADEKHSANEALKAWAEVCQPDKDQKRLAHKFTQRIKPYFESLLSLNGKKVSKSSLKVLQREMDSLGRVYLPIDNTPSWFPPVDFYVVRIEEEMKYFIKQLETDSIKAFKLVFSEKMRARLEVMLMMVRSYTPDSPGTWELH